MSVFRSYDRPGHPGAIYRVPNFVKPSTKYSPQLKLLALQGFAERVPDFPEVCPRCPEVDPTFVVQCGFKTGIAGAAIFICRGCGLPHIPIQMGPTNEHLLRIEQQRRFDTAQARASKAANDLVVWTRKGRTRGGIPQHLTKSAQLLFRNPVPDGRGGIREGDPMTANGPASVTNTALEVVLFYKAGDAPVTRADYLRGDGRIYLADYQWLLPYCEETHIYVFERWELFAHRWITIPHATSSFEIPIKVDTIFLRVWGLSCFNLGRELRRYDERHGMDLLPTDRISSHIAEVVEGYIWLVAWTKPDEGPMVASLPRKASKRRSDIHVEDWFGPHGVTYWVESEYCWAPFPPPQQECMKVERGANAILLRRADIARLLGFGDALECLERSRRLRDTARYAVEVLGLSGPQLGNVLAPHLTHISSPAAGRQERGTTVDASVRPQIAARARVGEQAFAPMQSAGAHDRTVRWRAKVAPGGYRIIFEGGQEIIDLTEE